MKKPIIRQCIQSKERLEKKTLFRIVKTKENEVLIDQTGKINGRGVYLKKDKNIILLAQKKRILEKELEVNSIDKIYEEMLNLINE